MEKAGEGEFPLSLSKRWDHVGKDLLEALLNYHGTNNDVLAVSLCVNRLWDVFLLMLEGMMVNKAQAGDNDDDIGVRIAIGPSKTGGKM